MFTATMLLFVQINFAQNTFTKQVIVCSGGNISNPNDFVTIASYSPVTGVTTVFDTIQTQSVQDVIIEKEFAFVAAQDSIVKFNIDTYEKIAAVEAVGVNRLLVNNDELIASFQYPVTENFVRVYSAEDLSLISNIEEVSDESAGLLVVDELAYVAVPGGWASTVGKIAIIDLADYSLVEEINFDTIGRGIVDLFYSDNKIMSVNRTPWGGSSGYISVMNRLGSHSQSHLINEYIGPMSGLINNILYIEVNGGIGSIDLTDFSVLDTVLVQPPALTIADVAMDTLNKLFYVTTTDFFSTGLGTIYNLDGEDIGSFEAGISPDAIAIDYRDNTGTGELFSENLIKIYPNPSSGVIIVEVIEGTYPENFRVVDISGRSLISGFINLKTKSSAIDINMLENGLYFLILSDGNKMMTSPIIKN